MMRPENDPWFDGEAVISRVKNLWLQLLACRCSGDLEPVKPYFSEALYEQESEALRQDQEAGQARYAERPAVLDGTLELLPGNGEGETLVCRLFTRYTPRILRRDSDEVLRQGKESFFNEEWTLVRPSGVKTPKPGAAFSVNCPNCGAPFSLYKSAKCPMCRSLISVPDFVWTVDRISC